MKVLIADSDPVSSQLLRETLEKEGHEVTLAMSAGETWEAYQQDDYRLVFCDSDLPDMPGLELCQLIRTEGGNPNICIVLLTENTQDDKYLGLHNGADDYLTKPFTTEELIASLHTAHHIISLQEEIRQLSNKLEQKQQELVDANRRLSELSIVDGLTGLKNHRALREDLEAAFSFSRRHSMPFSIIMLDIDHFKLFNTEFGHPAGDEVLRSIAKILQKLLRDHDIAGRYGGEEFAVIMPATNQAGCLQVAERLRCGISSFAWPQKQITVSLGTSTFTTGTPNIATLLEQADQALHRSKQNGRNLVTCFLERGFTLQQ